MSGIQDRVRGALVALIKAPPERLPIASEVGVPEMVGALGPALLSSSQATSDVQETLERVAAAYERPDLRVFVLPTLVIVEDTGVAPSHTAIYPANNQQLRLDQAGAVDHVVRHAAAQRDDPNAVVAEIRRIEDRPPRFGVALTIFGHLLLTLGFGLVLNPTVAALPVYAVLGAIVGTIVTFGTRMPTLSLILPVFTAFVVTLVTSYAADAFIHDDVLRLVAPALVSFLPGLTLTIAAVELTSGQVMAGASRLVYGIARLALLAFGVFAAIVVTGHPAQVDVHAQPARRMGAVGRHPPGQRRLLLLLGGPQAVPRLDPLRARRRLRRPAARQPAARAGAVRPGRRGHRRPRGLPGRAHPRRPTGGDHADLRVLAARPRGDGVHRPQRGRGRHRGRDQPDPADLRLPDRDRHRDAHRRRREPRRHRRRPRVAAARIGFPPCPHPSSSTSIATPASTTPSRSPTSSPARTCGSSA